MRPSRSANLYTRKYNIYKVFRKSLRVFTRLCLFIIKHVKMISAMKFNSKTSANKYFLRTSVIARHTSSRKSNSDRQRIRIQSDSKSIHHISCKDDKVPLRIWRRNFKLRILKGKSPKPLTLILRRSRTGTVWFYTSTNNKRAVRPKLYTKSLTRDLKLMYSRLTLVRISINL